MPPPDRRRHFPEIGGGTMRKLDDPQGPFTFRTAVKSASSTQNSTTLPSIWFEGRRGGAFCTKEASATATAGSSIQASWFETPKISIGKDSVSAIIHFRLGNIAALPWPTIFTVPLPIPHQLEPGVRCRRCRRQDRRRHFLKIGGGTSAERAKTRRRREPFTFMLTVRSTGSTQNSTTRNRSESGKGSAAAREPTRPTRSLPQESSI